MSHRDDRSPLRSLWHHVPIPEQHIVAISVGLVAQARRPFRLPRRLAPWGWLIVAIGILTNIVAVGERGADPIDEPKGLSTGGLHGLTRNPMYLGWSSIHIGLAFGLCNGWLLTSWPISAGWTHRVVMAEERRLIEQFGEEYIAYTRRVPRYLLFL